MWADDVGNELTLTRTNLSGEGVATAGVTVVLWIMGIVPELLLETTSPKGGRGEREGKEG